MSKITLKSWVRIFWIIRQFLLQPIPDLTKDQDEYLYLCAVQVETKIQLYELSILGKSI